VNSDPSGSKEAAAAAEQVLQISMGYIPSACLNVAARLGVADRLAKGPANVQDIARSVEADEDALYRVMRALSTIGVFEERDDRYFAQTPASDVLRSDHPQSLRAMVVFIADPLHFRCYANLMHSVKTGETTASPTLGKPVFEYLQSDPEESKDFNAAMVNLTQMFIPAVLQAYDFGDIGTLIDVGGGHGSVIASILQKYPRMKGVLYDLDHVVRGAGALLSSMGVADRCEARPGDFFKSVPAGGDAYIMKNIIHDWNDRESLLILNNIKQAMTGRPHAKVLLLETVLAGRNQPDMGKWSDIEMMALPGGRERTEEEFRELFRQAGFRLNRVVPTQGPPSVIEASLL
jgi:hypothetical protein